jgi:P4 family phage/plasmid primase-like protien
LKKSLKKLSYLIIMNLEKGSLYNFLMENKVERGQNFTHTSIYQPTGSFYILPEKEKVFFELYKDALARGEDMFLTEKHRDVGPITIDLDFRFKGELQRYYKYDDLLNIVKVYVDYLSRFYDMNGVKIYVMEKPHPVDDRGLVKDGIHIMIPQIITKPSFQFMMREDLLVALDKVLKPLKLHNDIKNIVDEAVIEKNNWQMYGSKKPHCNAYRVTHVMINDANGLKEDDIPNETDLVEILSIRNKYKISSIKIEQQEVFQAYEQRIKDNKMKQHLRNTIISKTKNLTKNTGNLDEVAPLIDMLSQARSDNYVDWIRVGWCLRNIDFRLMDKWIEFSKKSSKFREGECEKIWDYMRQDGGCLGIGTLHMWAKEDNADGYREHIRNGLFDLIRTAKSKTHYDVARVVYMMYRHQFVYGGCRSWYEFKNHRWHHIEDAYTLKKKLPTEVATEFMNVANYFTTRTTRPDVGDDERDGCAKTAKELMEMFFKLKNVPFQKQVIDACAMEFMVEDFEEKLDSLTHLVGFENGVYDLDAMEFRDGRPEDFISLSTLVNYVPCDMESQIVKDIQTFMSQVIVDQEVRDYYYRLLASFLHGTIRHERFHIFTGSGSNGKSKSLELFEKSFGEYCCKLPITLLTQKRGASGAASPEMARAKSKRFACLQEPGESERLNIGLMKEITGGDKVYCRALYKEGFEYKPQFKLVLTCNHLPAVPSDDGGTWRRIRVVAFKSKFLENPDPNNPNEFPIDTDLSQRFEEWKEAFISLLIEHYKKSVTEKLKEPEEVLKCTREYQRRNDIMADFLDTGVEKIEIGFLPLSDVFYEFKLWLKEENIDRGFSMRKSDFMAYIEKQYGKSSKVNKVQGWKGYRLKAALRDIGNGEVDEYDN